MLLLSSMFVYDVWWVFIQPLVTSSESVMIAVRLPAGDLGSRALNSCKNPPDPLLECQGGGAPPARNLGSRA